MLNENEVEYELLCEPEEIQIRGNCMASGDDEVDEDCAKSIESQLDAGNEWAWCSVRVTARWNGIEASDNLGGCSYASEKDFREDVYFTDMKDQALALLREQIPEPGDEVIIREEVHYTVVSVSTEEKTATLKEDGRTVPWSDIEPYKSL